ncbi:MAG: tol-pal system-associated acyl-CoA thioesterase [Burkholderiales bacterium]|nr:tol-pal system-associated acyl-CoA thioesterase [Burkholderiales bacterium]
MLKRQHLPARPSAAPHAAAAAHQPHQPFLWPIRVYYEDTDAGGVVFYANYLGFMERARTEWLRALGFEQPEMAARDGVLFVVRAVNIDYLKPSRFNDSLQVTVEVVNVGGSRIRFLQRVLRGNEEIARAEVEVVCVSTDTLRPARMPEAMRMTIEKS